MLKFESLLDQIVEEMVTVSRGRGDLIHLRGAVVMLLDARVAAILPTLKTDAEVRAELDEDAEA